MSTDRQIRIVATTLGSLAIGSAIGNWLGGDVGLIAGTVLLGAFGFAVSWNDGTE